MKIKLNKIVYFFNCFCVIVPLYTNLFIQYANFIRIHFIRIYLFNTKILFDLTWFEFIYLIRNFYSNSLCLNLFI